MSKYAIIQTGAKQYRVETDTVFDVEKLEVEPKNSVNLDKVLLVSDGKTVQVGDPMIKGAKVICDVVDQVKAKKVINFKFRRRKDSERKVGHRQPLTRLKVKEIQG